MSRKKIDINTATVEECELLTGVGRAKAEAIVETRKVQKLYIFIMYSLI